MQQRRILTKKLVQKIGFLANHEIEGVLCLENNLKKCVTIQHNYISKTTKPHHGRKNFIPPILSHVKNSSGNFHRTRVLAL